MTFWWLDRFLVHIVKTDEINRYNRSDGSEVSRHGQTGRSGYIGRYCVLTEGGGKCALATPARLMVVTHRPRRGRGLEAGAEHS